MLRHERLMITIQLSRTIELVAIVLGISHVHGSYGPVQFLELTDGSTTVAMFTVI